MVYAFLFDLDGVLVDSEDYSRKASDRVLAEVGITLTEAEKKNVFGRRTLENYERYIKSRELDLDANKLLDQKNRLFAELISGKLKLLPGVTELFALLDETGIKKALVSSSPLVRVNATLEEVGLLMEFDVIVSGDCCSRGKPDPAPFLFASEKIGAEPGECVVVEDAQVGVEAALAAGMRVIAVDSPSTHGQDLSQADIHLNSLKQIDRKFIEDLA
ncbi:MAG: HAD-IA family hydrolase [Candidatus Altiarchaeales archaeon]|nr:HAD-IA family hydrolase [Candidatus Altiarchaeales archaeon]